MEIQFRFQRYNYLKDGPGNARVIVKNKVAPFSARYIQKGAHRIYKSVMHEK